MTPSDFTPADVQQFDPLVEDYEATVSKSVRLFGEPAEYFARQKLARIQQVCGPIGASHILDVGCGVGLLTALLGQAFPACRVTGLECSVRSVERAVSRCTGLANVSLEAYDGTRLPEHLKGVDMAVLANVLHHVKPAVRRAFFREVVQPALAPGARVVVFEHNPYNFLTQFVVRSSPIDRDAHLVTRRMVSRLLTDAGFRILQRDYTVFFPRALRWARSLEGRMGWLPLGAQYMVVGQWPGTVPAVDRGSVG